MNAKQCQCAVSPNWFRATRDEYDLENEHVPGQTLVSCHSCYGVARVKSRHAPEQAKLPATEGDIANVRHFLLWREREIAADVAEQERFSVWSAAC